MEEALFLCCVAVRPRMTVSCSVGWCEGAFVSAVCVCSCQTWDDCFTFGWLVWRSLCFCGV